MRKILILVFSLFSIFSTVEAKSKKGQDRVLIDKVAYLDYIVTTIQVNENDEIDLDNVELIPR